ncbi:hypothetical protein C8F01DRAFT_1176319 [Mycena amicta]|nr:hypothetical protein C8F01DRAFT_1176319 [Mycena amicta]
MTSQRPSCRTAVSAILLFSCFPGVFGRTCINGVCDDDSAAISTVAIAGIIIGVILLLSIGAVIFAVIRYRRNRAFQRSYFNRSTATASGCPCTPSTHHQCTHPRRMPCTMIHTTWRCIITTRQCSRPRWITSLR